MTESFEFHEDEKADDQSVKGEVNVANHYHDKHRQIYGVVVLSLALSYLWVVFILPEDYIAVNLSGNMNAIADKPETNPGHLALPVRELFLFVPHVDLC